MASGWRGKAERNGAGSLIASHDWSRTPLGPRERWPGPLAHAASLCQGADFPLGVWWGQALIQFYNEAFQHAIGPRRHLSGFGAALPDAWPDVWPALRETVSRVLESGSPARLDHLPLLDIGSRPSHPGLFSLSMSPLRAGDGEPVEGLLVAFHEAVPWREVDRAQGFLLALEAGLRPLHEEDDLAAKAQETIGLHFGMARAQLVEFPHTGGEGVAWPPWGGPAVEAEPFRLPDFAPAALLGRGRAAFSGDVSETAEVAVPLLAGGGLSLLLVGRLPQPRAWDESETALLADALGRVRHALDRIRAEAACRRRVGELERQLGELQGHSRHTLGMIRAVARRSAETAGSAPDLAMHLDGRIDAFVRAQAVVTRDPDGGVDLDYLVAEELAAHGAHEDGVIKIDGPPVRLRLLAAQTIGLAVHELVSHAVSRGALRTGRGSIRIGWTVTQDTQGEALVFDWEEEAVEEGGAEMPAFSVLEKTLAHEMHARTQLLPRPNGFACRILVPFSGALAQG